ncbi:type IV secretion system protein [Sulfuricella sp.]|uniref:type IV secretion system protein n=1 Tax=Sulfuricella sp. TaxID=2099377 RepID=UPI002C604803|nr:type IV secretion system protein [Sulfuricella sp.]HUX64326.1 type IV secretion system protein [Sulfuricella sp.]
MELFQILTNISSSIDAAGKAMSTNLTDGNFSTYVLMICFGLEIAWLLVQVALDDDGGGAVAKGIRAITIAMISWSLILHWPAVADDITKTSAAVVHKIGKNQDLGNIVSGTLDKALQNTNVDQVYAGAKSTNLISSFSVGQIFDKFLAGWLGMVNGGVVGIVAAISIFIILLGKIVLWVGVVFGPLCVAFAPWKPARKITESWASFTFASMMFPAVAAAVLILSGGIFDALASMAQKAGSQTLPSTVYSIASLAIAVVGGMVMLQVPSITQAIFGNALGFDSPNLPSAQQIAAAAA